MANAGKDTNGAYSNYPNQLLLTFAKDLNSFVVLLDSRDFLLTFCQFITTVVTSWLDGRHVSFSKTLCG